MSAYREYELSALNECGRNRLGVQDVQAGMALLDPDHDGHDPPRVGQPDVVGQGQQLSKRSGPAGRIESREGA